MTIYKYPIEITGRQDVALPLNAIILSAQVQHGIICLWAQVEEAEPAKSIRRIEIFGTGHLMDPNAARVFIGTVQTEGGLLVWHIFERTR